MGKDLGVVEIQAALQKVRKKLELAHKLQNVDLIGMCRSCGGSSVASYAVFVL